MTDTRATSPAIALLATALMAAGCGGAAEADPPDRGGAAVEESPSDTVEVATFAGGCFWCVEEAFQEEDGVLEAVSGYTGGELEDPSYERVSSGRTGHYEAVEVRYDPSEVSYERLLEVFWHNVDPTDAGGQFCDRGPQYRTAIFVHGPAQREAAEASKRRLQEGDEVEEEIVTPILEAGEFWPAEDYHQEYYREHRVQYQFYKASCGRKRTLKEIWGEEAGG